MNKNKSVLQEKSFLFAVECIKIYKHLIEFNKEYILSKQLLRSGTSIGANIREAQNAESKVDFIHKLGISQKECDETLYWLELLYACQYLNQKEFDTYSIQASELLRIIKSSILSSKANLNKN